MRLDWLKERASQQLFRLVFLPGLINPADLFLFTKILLVYRHIAALPFLHGTPYPILFAPKPHPITSHPRHRSSRRDAVLDSRQGPTYPSLPLTSPHFRLPLGYHLPLILCPLSSVLFASFASNISLLTPVLSPPLRP